MGICSCNNKPTGSQNYTLLVDKLIGTPYEYVKFIANNIGLVSFVAMALQGMKAGEPMVSKRSATVTGKLGAAGSTTLFDLPEGVTAAQLLSVTVRAKDNSNTMLFNDARYFNVVVTAENKVKIDLAVGALALVEAPVQIFLVYEGQ